MTGGARARLVAGFAVLALVWTWHVVLIPRQGITDDDDFYAPAAISYATWLRDASSSTQAWSRVRIDAAFTPNHEHPPLAKIVMGMSHGLFTERLGVLGGLDGARAGTALFAAVLALAIVVACWRTLGVPAALAAPPLLVSLPRFAFHSEVATLDVPVATMVVVVTFAFFWAERRGWGAALVCGVLFGAALLTKLNAPFALVPCVAYALLARSRAWRSGSGSGVISLSLPPMPRALVAMVALGPVVFVVGWPWLWHDTFARLGAYFAFHLKHYPIYLFYDGEIFERPFAPWHASFTMALGVLPAPVLMLGLVGTLAGLRALLTVARASTVDGDNTASARERFLALVSLQAWFAVGVVAFSNVPRYGGEKLFMPFFPLFCVLGAAGADDVARAAQRLLRLSPRPIAHAALVALIAASAAAPGLWAFHQLRDGFALSYYGELVGGLRGAVARGHERTYYDVADKRLAQFLDERATGPVHFEPNHKEYARTYRWLARDGHISRELRLTERLNEAALVVLTHERRWRTYPTLLARFNDDAAYTVLHEERLDGVPLYTIYAPR